MDKPVGGAYEQQSMLRRKMSGINGAREEYRRGKPFKGSLPKPSAYHRRTETRIGHYSLSPRLIYIHALSL
jgi:hypothetical protein